MIKYPDEIIILKPMEGGTPYDAAPWEQVYRGKCRCFLDRQAAFRINKIMDCSYQVVIPDRHMVDIGENFKVGIKMHTSKSNHNWDLVGYVKDFARYDRVCNLYFQMVKENLIYEDLPPVGYDLTERKIVAFDDDSVHIESEGMLMNGEQLVAGVPVFAWFKGTGNKCLITSNLPLSGIEDEEIYRRVYGASDGLTSETNLCIFAGRYKLSTHDFDRVIFVPVYATEEGEDGEEIKPKITFHIFHGEWNIETRTYDEEEIYTKEYVIVE